MESVAKTAAKVVLKVGMNTIVPGSGSLIDFGEAAICLIDGDFIGASVNIVSGALDLITLGIWGVAKDAVKAGGKEAAVQATKQTAKQATKKIGQETAKKIAQEKLVGVAKKGAVDFAISSSKSATKKIGRDLAKDLARNMVGDTADEFMKSFAKVTHQSIMKESIRGGISSGGKDIFTSVFSSGLEETLTGAVQMASKTTAKQAFTSTSAKIALESLATSSFSSAARDVEVLKKVGTATLYSLNYIKK